MDGKIVGSLMFAVILGVSVPVVATTGQSVAVRDASEPVVPPMVVTLDVRNEGLERVLRSITRQAGLRLVVAVQEIPQGARVTMRVQNVPAVDALAQALVGTGLRARVTNGKVVLSAEADGALVPVVQGGISGKVIDGKTRQGLRGATITINGTNKETLSNDDGTFRVSDIVPGSYTVQARMLGYVKTSKTITVTDGQTTSIDLVLDPSVSALDQVIVTGTIVATAQREVPNAMTVITAKELEERGITRIEQLFRGGVPGIHVENTQSFNGLDAVTMFSRGATALTDASAGTSLSTNPIKTYVDGVELADPQYLSQIDPRSIERIEILTGPQASTIYGSNAINGVMQVFTKRGTSARRPQLTAALQSGWVENNYRPTRTPQHDVQTQVQGVEGHWAYNVGGSWIYVGPWTPAKQTSRTSGFGGARMQRGLLTADGNLRLATTRNRIQGAPGRQQLAQNSVGWYVASHGTGTYPLRTQLLQGQTLGLTIGYAPMGWWSHEVVVGQDRSAVETRTTSSQHANPADTLLALSQGDRSRTSWRYATTAQGRVGAFAKAVVTVGGDGWETRSTSLSVSPPSLTGTLTGAPIVTRLPDHNAGGFVQGQLGLTEQLFFTYGLRAEWNPAFGEHAQPNLAPRYGMTFVRDIVSPLGVVTAKLRASYGRSTRPPGPDKKQEVRMSQDPLYADYAIYYGDPPYTLGNPDLSPEHQQGGEGGIELFLGSRGSVVVTRYNQTVVGLLARPIVDSVRSLAPGAVSVLSRDEEGYGYWRQTQWLNFGTIRNQGWEGQATMNLGALTTTGTWSFTKSRVIGVTDQFKFTSADEIPRSGQSFRYLPEHTWAWSIRYAHAATSVALNWAGTGPIRIASNANLDYWEKYTLFIRLQANRSTMATSGARIPQNANPAYSMADVNVTHRFSSALEGVLQINNLTDRYQNDRDGQAASLGRQSKFGLRLRL